MRTVRRTVAACIASLLLTGSVTRAAETIVPLTGFNQDVVWAASETWGLGTAYTTDIGGQWAFYEQGAGSTQGLPNAAANRTFTSAANSNVQFQFADYTASNALVLDSTVGGPVAGTLTLSTPASFQTLHLLETSYYSPAADFSVTLNFSDGSHTQYSYTGQSNWLGNPANNSALTNYGLRQANVPYEGYWTSSLYMPELDLSLSPTDQAKTLNSITTNVTAGYVMVFALSGDTVASSIPEPASAMLLVPALALVARRRR